MKITITLSEAEVKGMKAYLQQVGDIARPTNKDLALEVRGYVHGILQAPQEAVSHYVRKFENENLSKNENR